MLKTLGNDVLILIASFLKLWDVSLICRAIGNVKGIYSKVKLIEINKFSNINMIAKHCKYASILNINVSVKDKDLHKLKLPIERIIYAAEIPVNRELEIFPKLSYLEADRVPDLSKLPNIEVNFRERITKVSDNITKLHGKLYSPESLRNLAENAGRILPFESLYISNVNAAAVAYIREMPLKKLEIIDPRSPRPDISSLACLKLESLTLKTLDVPANFTSMPLKELICIGGSSVSSKIRFHNLQKLKIFRCQVNIECIVHQPITELTLSNCTVTNLKSLRKMKITHLDFTPSEVPSDAVDVICSLPLVSLKIDNVSLSDTDISKFPSTLKKLSITAIDELPDSAEDPKDSDYAPDSEIEITGEVLPTNLTELELHDIFLTEAGLRNIARLPLQSLTLVNCKLTDEKIRILYGMKLAHINVCGNKITGCGLKGLMHMPLVTCKHDPVDFLRTNK